MGASDKSVQVRMKTPTGQIVLFQDWIRTVPTPHLLNDIKKMLVLVHKASAQAGAVNSTETRAALEATYFHLLVLLYPVDQPLPVKNEVDELGKK